MARLIAWDTSDKTGVLCLWESESGAAQDFMIHHQARLDVDQKQHSEGLFAGIEAALESAGWKLGSLDAIGIGIGPGSFTGIRVGVTAARTFGQMLGIPLVPVSSLGLVASEARSRCPTADSLAVCIDACMGEVYIRAETAPASVSEQVIRHSDPLQQGWRESLPERGLWVAPERRRDLAPSGWDFLLLPPVGGSTLARAVSESYASGRARAALEVHPAYLRAPDAELKLRQRQALNP